MTKCKTSRLLTDPIVILTRKTSISDTDPHEYRALVGSLIYLTNTCPYIYFAVGNISRYMDKPQIAHLQAAKLILKYLRDTIDFGLHFSSNGYEGLYSFADADWGRDIDTRRSTSETIVKFGDSAIEWASILQPIVSFSTTEAKYRILTNAAKDTIHLRCMITELGFGSPEPVPLMSDHQACIKLVNNLVMHQ
jgi:hypothetical protein